MKAWIEPDKTNKGIEIDIFQSGQFHPYAEISCTPADWHLEFGLEPEDMTKITLDDYTE